MPVYLLSSLSFLFSGGEDGAWAAKAHHPGAVKRSSEGRRY